MQQVDSVTWCEKVVANALLAPNLLRRYASGDSLPHSTLVPFADRLKRISERYTSHRPGSALASPIRDEGDAEAYALYYAPINFAKIHHVLGYLPQTFWKRDLRVLDYGSGPGTATLTVSKLCGSTFIPVLVETSSFMRATAQKLLAALSNVSESGGQIVSSLNSVSKEPFDLIIAANVIAELSDTDARELVCSLQGMLSENGALLLLEPGQQLQTRRLMHLRNLLLRNDLALAPVFPCPRRSPCPMLEASQTDWCHGTLHWDRPKLVHALDSLTGFNKHRIKYTAFLFQKSGIATTGFRLLRDPEKGRRGMTVPVCGPDYYGEMTVPKGTAEERYRCLRRSEQWDLVRISGLSEDGVLQPDSIVSAQSDE